MGSVTPTVVAAEGYVRVEANFQDFPHARLVWISRTVAGVTTVLRGGRTARLSNGIAVVYDHEMPLDVPVVYSATIALNYNPTFEDGVQEWLDTTNTGTIGTVTQSTAYWVPGAGNASLKLVPSGAAESRAVSEFIPATVGTSYTFTANLLISDYWAGGVGVAIFWFNGTSFLSASGTASDLNPFPGVWNGPYSVTATAPATTTQAKVALLIDGSAPSTLALYGDEAYFSTAAGTVAAAAVIVPSDGSGWWVDPLHPATKLRLLTNLQVVDCIPESAVGLVSLSEETFPADNDVQEVNNAVKPIGSWQVRKSGRQNIQVVTITSADLDQLQALHSTGAPLLLQLPAEYGEDPAYQLHNEIETTRFIPDHRHQSRLTRSAFTKVAAPVGTAEGTWNSRYVDLDRYATFADASAAGGGAYDYYTRSVSGGLGSTTSGVAYTTAGGSGSDYSVNGSQGLLSMGTLSVQRRAQLPSLSILSIDVTATFGISATITGSGGQCTQSIRARFVDASNFIEILIFRNVTGNNCTLAVSQTVAGVVTASSFPVIPSAALNSTITIRLVGTGTTLSGYAWIAGSPSTQTPLATLSSVTMLSAGSVELTSSLNGSVTNSLPVVTSIDDLSVTNLGAGGGATWLDAVRGNLAV